jgi:hypothetical protein
MISRLATLEVKVVTLDEELGKTRRKYWSAITYIRTLYTWIARLGETVDPATIPQPPATLAEDI